MQKIELKKQIQKYPEYKDSGVEWAGEIPLAWSCVPLRRVVKRIKNGTTEDQVEYEEGYEPVTRIETISKGMIDYEKVGFIKPKKSVTHYLLKPGDILMSHINSLEMVGNVALFNSGKRLFHGMNLLRIEAGVDISRPWLKYYFKSSLFNNLIKSISKHAINQVSVPINALRSLPCILPTTLVQQKIADYLDAKTAIIDKCIEQKEKLVELLKKKRAAVINRAVTRGLDEKAELVDSGVEWIGKVPKGWRVEKLKFSGQAIIGLTYGPDDVVGEKGTLVLRSSNVQNNAIELNDNVYVNKLIPKNLKTKQGDILICSRNGSAALIGKSAVINGPGEGSTFGVFMSVFRSKYWRYMVYFFKSELFFFQLRSSATSTINQLTIDDLKNIISTIPKIEEQEKIAKFLDEKIAKIDECSEKIQKSIELLQEYKSSLIYNVVTGKVKV